MNVEKERGSSHPRGSSYINVNCRNYYDIIIQPNCTSNRHAKCLIASSATERERPQRRSRARGGPGEGKVHAIKLIATTLEHNDNPGNTGTF